MLGGAESCFFGDTQALRCPRGQGYLLSCQQRLLVDARVLLTPLGELLLLLLLLAELQETQAGWPWWHGPAQAWSQHGHRHGPGPGRATREPQLGAGGGDTRRMGGFGWGDIGWRYRVGTLDRETLDGEMLDEGIGWRCWMETLVGNIGWEDVGQGHWIEMGGDVGWRYWMEKCWTGTLGGTSDRDAGWRHRRGRRSTGKHWMGRCCKETEMLDVRHWMESCWMETLDWETGQGEAQVHRTEMLDGDVGQMFELLDGDALEMLDGDEGDVGWGW